MTDELVDRKKIATQLSQRAIDRILVSGEKVLREYWARYKNRDTQSYTEYVVRKGVAANAVRNFFYDAKSAALYDIYVPTMIGVEGHRASPGDQLLRYLCEPVDDPKKRPTRAIAVVGNAGAGKSLFMKDAFFKISNMDIDFVPILIEARSMNDSANSRIEDIIVNDFVAMGAEIMHEQIENGLRSGLFVILLDGLDELKTTSHDHYERELMAFANRYPLCPILISSRPMLRMKAWQLFEIRTIAPLSGDAAESLIMKLEYDEDVKSRFVTLLRERLIVSHHEFVTSPLLCTIMLLTFSDTGFIAKYRHEFYEDAFLALWSKHDGRKSGFQRDRFTGLQRDEFLRLLAAFAVSSYASTDYEMRETQFHQHFEAAVRLSGIVCKEDDFQRDLIVSTSLAIQDGSLVRFCHRSFQEYFAALFVCDVEDSGAEDLIDELSSRIETDNVLHLVLSINEEKIEKHWVLPRIRSLTAYIVAMGEFINDYARLAGSLVKNDIRDEMVAPRAIMEKLRTLYKLRPSSEEVRLNYSSPSRARFGIKFFTGTPLIRNASIFEKDRDNFLSLAKELETKYQSRSFALRDLLRNRATNL